MNGQQKPQIGVHLLETITTGMYSEPLHTVREYIQNAWDSIREARRKGLLKAQDGEITLTVDRINRRLTIRDNGTGQSPEGAIVRLVDVGQSDKATTEAAASQNAGFRGIGRMAGISYCHTLRFDTSDGNGKATTITFDAASIRERARPGQEPGALDLVLSDNYTDDTRAVPLGEHYLEVTLEGIKPDHSPLLDEDRLRGYLAETAPVPYDPSTWAYREDILKAAADADCRGSLETVSITLRDPDGNVTDDIRRPFSNNLKTLTGRSKTPRRIRVQGIKPLPQNDIEPHGWWGWFAVHDLEGYLGDTPYAGLRLRRHNIAVGDDSIIRQLFKTAHLAAYVFGEIHITDPALVPNSQRDDFEDHPNWSRIKSELKDEAAILERAIRKESADRRRSTATLAKQAGAAVRQARDAIGMKFASHNEQQKTVGNLTKVIDKLKRAVAERKRPEQEKKRLRACLQDVEKTQQDAQNVQKFRSDDALSHLNSAARKAVRTVLEAFKRELPSKDYDRIEPLAYEALKPGRKK